MEAKEVIKKTLREKLEGLSKDELIDIIADMSSVYVLARAAGAMAQTMGAIVHSEVRTDLQSIANNVASTLANRDFRNAEVCKIDIPLWGKGKEEAK